MEALLVTQAKFFIDGPGSLQPLVMKTIAEQTGYDISTISRAVNGKYVQTRYGVFELKYFFSGSLVTDEGEELSSRIIKEQLRELIEMEDQASPLSDDRLAELLGEKGVKIARRTVAKYREQFRLEENSAAYPGWLHFAFTSSVSILVVLLCLSQLHQVKPLEWITIPVAFLPVCIRGSRIWIT